MARLLEEIMESAEEIPIAGEHGARIVFRDARAFELFGHDVLNPCDDYTYEWAYYLLERITDYLAANPESEDLSGFRDRELPEVIDSLVDAYASDLTRWLHDRNDNLDHLTEVLEAYGVTDGFQALALAQYTAIEETATTLCDKIDELLEGAVAKCTDSRSMGPSSR